MPHYHFNLHLEDQILRDRDGQDFTGPEAARAVARSIARDLMETALVQPADWLACHFEVTDDSGATVIDFPFVEAVETRQVA